MIFLMYGRRMMGDLVDISIVKIVDCRNILFGFFFISFMFYCFRVE